MILNCTNGKNEIVWPRPPKKETVKIKTLTLPAPSTPIPLKTYFSQSENSQLSRRTFCVVCKKPLSIGALKDFIKIEMPVSLMRCVDCIVKNDPTLSSLITSMSVKKN